MTVARAGAVPKLVGLLSSGDMNLVSQVVWALGNIAGDGPPARDLVLKCGGMTGLLGLVQNQMPVCYQSNKLLLAVYNLQLLFLFKEPFLRNLVWTISNLCRNKNPPPDFELVRPCLPVLHRMLFCEDSQVLGRNFHRM
jgi:importin subunit alpha-2